jgi:hypothetical protein
MKSLDDPPPGKDERPPERSRLEEAYRIIEDEDGVAIYFDNELIEASSDQEAIGKARDWAASHKLGVVAMLTVKQGFLGVHSRKIYLGA